MPAEQSLECDLKTEVNFVSRGADFEIRLENRSRLLLPRGTDFEMQLENQSRLLLPCEADFDMRLQ
jgi:hypothetical protein